MNKTPEITNEPVPTGAKQITRTTVERFSATDPPAANDDDPNVAGNVCPDCDVFSTAEEWKDNAGDCPACDQAEGLLPQRVDGEALTPFELLLQNLRGGDGSEVSSGRSGEHAVFYIKRLEDPPGEIFRTPCSEEKTVGKIAFEPRFADLEEIHLAVQKKFGGGKYRAELREKGNYGGSKNFTVGDLPALEASAPPVTSVPAPAAVPSASLQLDEVLSIAERIVSIRRNGAGQQAPAVLAPPPATPQEQITGMVGMFTAMAGAVSSLKAISGGGGATAAPSSFVKDAKDAVVEIAGTQTGAMITNFVLGLISEKIKENTIVNQIRMQELAAQRTAATPAAVPAAPQSAQVVADATANVSRETLPSPPLQSPFGSAVPASQTTLAVPQSDPAPSADEVALFAAIEIIVPQMRLYDAVDDEAEDADERLDECLDTAARALLDVPREVWAPLFDFAPAIILAQLSMFRPDWADVASLESGVEFVNGLVAEIKARDEAVALDVSGLDELLPESEPRQEHSQGGPSGDATGGLSLVTSPANGGNVAASVGGSEAAIGSIAAESAAASPSGLRPATEPSTVAKKAGKKPGKVADRI